MPETTPAEPERLTPREAADRAWLNVSLELEEPITDVQSTALEHAVNAWQRLEDHARLVADEQEEGTAELARLRSNLALCHSARLRVEQLAVHVIRAAETAGPDAFTGRYETTGIALEALGDELDR